MADPYYVKFETPEDLVQSYLRGGSEFQLKTAKSREAQTRLQKP